MLSFGRAFVATTVLFSICLAALLAHVGIDVAGNVFLSHDAYDDLEHASRSGVVALNLLVALGVMLSALSIAALEMQGRRPQLRALLRTSVGYTPAPFVVTVTAGSLAALLAMESFDTLVSNGHVARLEELLGGSIALGVGVVIACAVAIAFGVWNGVHFLLHSCRALVAALDALLMRLARDCAAKTDSRLAPAAPGSDSMSILSMNAGKRAPPLRA